MQQRTILGEVTVDRTATLERTANWLLPSQFILGRACQGKCDGSECAATSDTSAKPVHLTMIASNLTAHNMQASFHPTCTPQQQMKLRVLFAVGCLIARALPRPTPQLLPLHADQQGRCLQQVLDLHAHSLSW